MNLEELQAAIDRAIPIYAMGGLSGAMYKAESAEDTEAFAVDVADWKTISEAVRLVANPNRHAAYGINAWTLANQEMVNRIVDAALTPGDTDA